MDETAILNLPLLMPAQAQKHVAVNEALGRLDALAQLVVESRGLTTPPGIVVEGAVYAVPAGAVNAWAGAGGKLAVGLNGGWALVTPRRGWRAWIADEGRVRVFDGGAWVTADLGLSASGAASRFEVIEFEEDIAAGASHTTVQEIPADMMVFAVSARVTEEITGTLSGWEMGLAADPAMFGTGMGLAVGAWARGLLGAPMGVYAATPLRLGALGGDFAGGRVRIAVHGYSVGLPGL
ncbi:MAG: DUF2793 domain-containing protein [Celeribacter sp.]|jgi:hypothetical protein